MANTADAPTCMVCERPRPTPNDWVCANCGAQNPENAKKCDPPCFQDKPIQERNVRYILASVSQFTYGGQSACPFGALTVGQALWKKEIDLDSKEVENQLNQKIRETATTFARAGLPPGVQIAISQIFDPLPDQRFTLGQRLYPEIVQVEHTDQIIRRRLGALMGSQDFAISTQAQVRMTTEEHWERMLQAVQDKAEDTKQQYIVTVTIIGYAFGLLVKPQEVIVYDTHARSPPEQKNEKSVAYMMVGSVKQAANFIFQFVLDSVKTMQNALSDQDDEQQIQAAHTYEICMFQVRA
jgi:hypothetical protein